MAGGTFRGTVRLDVIGLSLKGKNPWQKVKEKQVGTASAGATPPFVASRLMFTWMQTSSGALDSGRARASAAAIFARSTACTQSKRCATSRATSA